MGKIGFVYVCVCFGYLSIEIERHTCWVSGCWVVARYGWGWLAQCSILLLGGGEGEWGNGYAVDGRWLSETNVRTGTDALLFDNPLQPTRNEPTVRNPNRTFSPTFHILLPPPPYAPF